MKKLIELLRKPHSKVAIVVEDGTTVTTEDTAQGLLEQMIIYAELDAKEGWVQLLEHQNVQHVRKDNI